MKVFREILLTLTLWRQAEGQAAVMQGTVRPPLNTQIEATNEKDLRSERLIHNLYQTIGPTSSITVIFISKKVDNPDPEKTGFTDNPKHVDFFGFKNAFL